MSTESAEQILAIKQQYLLEKQLLQQQCLQILELKPSATVNKFLRQHTKLVDGILHRLWQLQQVQSAVLVAVGGYGRSELFPHSDIDVLVLLHAEKKDEINKDQQDKIENFIQSCWDVGLRIGSSVRTIAECSAQAKNDLTTQTSFLESHYLCGDKDLFQRFLLKFSKIADCLDFCNAKQLEQTQRRNKYNNTPYSLEPNCKESPGALRDLHVIRWCALAIGMGKSWQSLQQADILTNYELRQVKNSLGFLHRIRFLLHILTNREEDRLLFDWHDKLAQMLGFDGDTPQQRCENFMRHYYHCATEVVLINKIAWLNILSKISQVTPQKRPVISLVAGKFTKDFYTIDNWLEIANDDLYIHKPHCILQTFYLYACEPNLQGLSSRTLRALNHANKLINKTFIADKKNQQMFLNILKIPKRQVKTLRLMNRTAILAKVIPEFKKLVGQMQFDLYHIYTVDQHSLQAAENVQRFFMSEYAHQYPLAAEIAARFAQSWLIILAALFHDIGKGRGGDHSKIGAKLVKQFAKRFQLDKMNTSLLEFLVAQHLTMSLTAQKADLEDQEIIQSFVNKVNSQLKLDALYMLTVADIRATNPSIWSAWKQNLLDRLYHKAKAMLGNGKTNNKNEIERKQQRVLQQLSKQFTHLDVVSLLTKLWQQFSIQYFIRHDLETMSWHATELFINHEDSAVKIRQHKVSGSWQVLVYLPDQPMLFARVCAFFARQGFSILDARIYTSKDGFSVDTFSVLPQIGSQYTDNLASDLALQLLGFLQTKGKTKLFDKKISRRARYFPVATKIELSPDDKHNYWVLTIKTNDRVGLLRDLALVLQQHEIDIHLAKIMTLAERAEDTFLIQGEKLLDEKFRIQLEREIIYASVEYSKIKNK